ncbi:cytochrome c3 family protein [Desulfuromonas acetoxidans]|uniref:Tetraheme cytochrome c n=1 Tax=Desulfuromonas acetoxidans (strain DSM 684 / 11070) TaxID=281689 RepID=Q1JXD3_DESA6|nr:cytochrome c3 family protein [Desulfuromonas acetoxidans]EAT14859.1 tetraheme cytochrome c [Desulfuromonas acetoxidans DSM 684]MBF0644081.1 cytochrome c3 family protein [Desulfuromonas acetoxidans]NVD23319.1 cytochrome c3 family protein [Desulfuromonas acetoxidans]NVE15440.1 cytochrome c3 family protein [Desulfuromonas acetoxidans]
MKNCLIFLTLFLMAASAAQAMNVGGAHADFDFSCADCHHQDEPEKAPSMKDCLACHGTYEELAELTKPEGEPDPTDPDTFANPHHSHMGPVPCMECHKTHQKSVLICEDCHNFDMQPK